MEDQDIGRKPPSDWQPITNKCDLAVLGKLIEELNECAGIAARCIIQGFEEQEPLTKKYNRKAMEDEIADVHALIDRVIMRFDLDMNRIDERRQEKFDWKAPWFEKLAEQDTDENV